MARVSELCRKTPARTLAHMLTSSNNPEGQSVPGVFRSGMAKIRPRFSFVSGVSAIAPRWFVGLFYSPRFAVGTPLRLFCNAVVHW
jgi:hypothetical protein